MTYYQIYSSMKSSYVFSYSFLKKLSSGARIVRRSHRYTDKALEANKDFSVDFEGIPQPWTTAPPYSSSHI